MDVTDDEHDEYNRIQLAMRQQEEDDAANYDDPTWSDQEHGKEDERREEEAKWERENADWGPDPMDDPNDDEDTGYWEPMVDIEGNPIASIHDDPCIPRKYLNIDPFGRSNRIGQTPHTGNWRPRSDPFEGHNNYWAEDPVEEADRDEPF